MKSRSSDHVRLDPETKRWLKKISLELSANEGKYVSIGEVLRRIKSGEDIAKRLMIGSIERIRGLR